jgi:hypothetical protein
LVGANVGAQRSQCLVLLMVYDRPFAVGGVTMAPTAFRELAVD